MRHFGRGRSPRRVTVLMMMLVGAGLFFVLLVGDQSGPWSELPRRLIVRYIVTMSLGGALAGWLLAGLFGRRGVAGWLLTLLGAAATTVIAGFLGSAMGMLPDLLADGWQMADFIPILFGLVVLPLAFAGQPGLFLVWLALIALTHVWARQARRGGAST